MSAEEAGAAQSSSTRTVDTGLLSLAVLARLQGKPAQPEQLRRELGLTGPASADDLLRAARRLDLKAKKGALDVRRLEAGTAPLPCIVERRSGGFAVLARFEQGKGLIHDPVEGRPRTLSTPELQAELNGQAVFVVSRAVLARELARFDFTWFVPAIVKYRRLIGEALLASLALQVFALLTPLFFQVVSTRCWCTRDFPRSTVIAIGLLAAVLFESALTALRTYVFAHTTSRIDVELGARLFRHVLALPLAYFEARRVGDTVARVRELENIRQFLTGSALTSLIDIAFARIFIAVMLYYSPLAHADRAWRDSVLRGADGRGDAGVPPAAQREIRPRRREPGVPRRGRHRHPDAQGRRDRAAGDAALGRAARGLCRLRLQGHAPRRLRGRRHSPHPASWSPSAILWLGALDGDQRRP